MEHTYYNNCIDMLAKIWKSLTGRELFTFKLGYEGMNVDDVVDVFERNGLNMARCLSYSKSGYRQQFPTNTVFFNGNILIEGLGKVWYGDIDLTREYSTLQTIADDIGYDLYVLREMDARFGKENDPFENIKNRAVAVVRTIKKK